MKLRVFAWTALEIIQATTDDPEDALAEIVTDMEYQTTFLKLARNLAPSGNVFGQLEVKSTSAHNGRPVILLPGSREAINHVLKKQNAPPGVVSTHEGEPIRGILRALHLDKDWLEITIHRSQTIRIHGAGDEVDDVLGSMVNREVLVDVFVKRGGKKYFLRDIQAAE
jgi:hypothetical protein